MKKLLLSTVLALGWFAAPGAAPASAQTPANCGVNFNPIVGVNCANVRSATYVGQILNLAPAASASDIWCINGSASKAISIRQVQLSGIATANTSIPLTLIRRNTLDTAGTSSVPNVSSLRSNNPTATAALIQYTANPTINDTTSHQTLAAGYLVLNTAATPTIVNNGITWNFGTAVDQYNQGVDILAGATTQQICLNYGAGTAAGNNLLGTVQWTEQ